MWKLRLYENLHDLGIEACTNAGFLRVDTLGYAHTLIFPLACVVYADGVEIT